MLNRFCETCLVPVFGGKAIDTIFLMVLLGVFLSTAVILVVGGIIYALFIQFDTGAWATIGFFATIAGISYLISRCVEKHKSGGEEYGSRGWD